MRGLRYSPGEVVRFDDGADDAFGNPARTETTRTATRASLQQRSTAEPRDQGRTVTLYDLFLPPGTPIDAGDEWHQDGQRYTVEGQPVRARGARGEHHVEAVVQHVGPVE